ncbi:MAG TPA: TIGR03435 family protein [Bryobacteraceae bacterium]|jgi:uncharacterized protein (TIGR03435 family)|nr:TIGR03435 family protein [Bryobacteraceae bacterium]
MRLFGTTVLPILLACSAFAQQTSSQTPAQSPKRVEFEVASIRPAGSYNDTGGKVSLGLHIDGSQVRFTSLSLRDYMARAYRTKLAMISGPDWTASERYDIQATLPAGSTQAQIPEMLQALLADRFHLKLHTEKKDFPIYALVTGKGLKLTPSPDSGADQDAPNTTNIAAAGSEAGVGANLGHGSSYTLANDKFEAKKLSMSLFATSIERYADRPIIDMTGLTGKYDFTVNLTREDYQLMLIRAALSAGITTLPPQALRFAAANSSNEGLSDALLQVGLKLDARKAPLDVLVIDDALKTPTEN